MEIDPASMEENDQNKILQFFNSKILIKNNVSKINTISQSFISPYERVSYWNFKTFFTIFFNQFSLRGLLRLKRLKKRMKWSKQIQRRQK